MNLPHILDNIINLFNSKGDSVLGVDIGSSSIKIVQLKNKGGRALLETYGEVALGPYGETDIGRAVKLQPVHLVTALNDALKESNTTTKTGGVAIPLASSLITTMKVPKISNANLQDIVAMEARRYIPVSMSEITLDWQVIPSAPPTNVSKGGLSSQVGKEPQSNTSPQVGQGASVSSGTIQTPPALSTINSEEILIVAVHTEAIEKMKESLNEAGVNCTFLELEAFSTIRAVLGGETRTVVIVDLGAASTKIYVVEGGIIRVSHVVAFGSQDITLAISRSMSISVSEAERLKRAEGIPSGNNNLGLNKLLEGSVSFSVNEVKKVIREYQSKNNSVTSEIVLTGGGVGIKGFADMFKDKIMMPVRVADPFSNVVAPAFLEKVLKSIGPTFSVAIGAALRAVGEGH